MKVIGFDDIVSLNISPKLCYEWVCDMLLKKNTSLLPAKISMKPEGLDGVFFNCMPCIIPHSDCAGVKLVTRYPDREPSLDSQILLYRLSTGENIALLDGSWITTMRTGAVAAHSILQFALPGFESIGIIGLGNTARATLKILNDVLGYRTLRVYLKAYKNQHELFAKAYAEYPNLTFEYCDNIETVISNSDVIISAVTIFKEDICDDRYFRKGCLLVPIHTRGFTNCDLFFDKIYADDVKHVKGFQNFQKFRYFAEVADVVQRKSEGRTSNDERILVYNIGIALHDLYFASKIVNMISSVNEITLNSPTDKFWV